MNKETIRKHLRIPGELYKQVDQFKKDYYFPSTSQAIVHLIHMGLEYTYKMKERTLSSTAHEEHNSQ